MKHRHLRLDLNDGVALFWNGIKKRAEIENISVGGVLMRAHLPVQVGDFMSMRLEDKSWPVTMEMRGEVIRTGQTRRGMPAFALKFRTIPEALKMFLRHVIANRTALADW